MRQIEAIAAILAFALAMGSLMWIATFWGTGTSPDSISYMMSANKIEEPRDIFYVSGHWPPLYPLLLKAAQITSNDLFSGARLLHVWLYAINIFLVFALLSRGFKNIDAYAVTGTTLFACVPGVFSVHYMAWSEPFFLTCTVLALLTIQDFKNEQPTSQILLTALFCSLALLTRYAGIALIGSICLLLLYRGENLKRGFSLSAVFGLIALVPLTFYLSLKNLIHEAGSSPRAFNFHPIEPERAARTIDVVLAWMSPAYLPAPISIILGLMVLGTVIGGLLLRSSPELSRLIALHLLVAAFYVAFLFTSISFFDFYTPVDNRTLIPILPSLLAAAIFAIRSIGNSWSPARAGYLLLLGTLTVASLLPSAGTAARLSQGGSGYLSNEFRNQDLLPKIAELPKQKIYSNSRETIQLYFGIDTEVLPATKNMVDNIAITSAGEDYLRIAEEVRDGYAAIIYFDRFAWRKYFPEKRFFSDQLKLPQRFIGASGVIYAADNYPLKGARPEE